MSALVSLNTPLWASASVRETIFVDKTEIGEARRQGGPRHVDFALDALLQSANKRVDVLCDECGGVRVARFSVRETTHFGWARHPAAKSRSSASQSGRSSSQ